jgi:hypothetical protein
MSVQLAVPNVSSAAHHRNATRNVRQNAVDGDVTKRREATINSLLRRGTLFKWQRAQINISAG